VNEPEVRQIFMLIQNTNGSFDYDDDKVLIWTDLLREVPFDLAQRNLRRHLLTNKHIPVPAEISKPEPVPEQIALYHDHLRDSAQQHMVNLVEWQKNSVVPPDEVRERMRQLAERQRTNG
jgi:hypothetical protein